MDDLRDLSLGVWMKVRDSDEALARTLEQILRRGHDVPAAQPYKETLGLGVAVRRPRARILANPVRPFPIFTAVARLVWMVAGSDRLADIAFYEPRVKGFTDDGLRVPGSNYGARLFQPRPGIDQVAGVIERLRAEAGTTRRAAAVIWQPEDAVRDSADIPCAMGLTFQARDGVLLTTNVMRSNNAVTLLPLNLFELGMLAELIAVESGCELGPQLHFASSMHVFARDFARARATVAGYWDHVSAQPAAEMPAMPADPGPFEQSRTLARLEAELRHDLVDLQYANETTLLARAADELCDYWLSLYRVLLIHALRRLQRPAAAADVAAHLPDHLRGLVEAELVAGA